jgi:hypothetical protein
MEDEMVKGLVEALESIVNDKEGCISADPWKAFNIANKALQNFKAGGR